MEFEYKIQRQDKSKKEWNRYILHKQKLMKIYQNCVFASEIVTFIVFLYALFPKGYMEFRFVLITVCIEVIILALIYALTHMKRKRKKRFKSKFLDEDSLYKVTVENDVLIREDEFSRLEVPFENISNIDILEYGIVIYFYSTPIFIPKESLPVSVDEFIEMFRNKNRDLKTEDYALIIRKSIKFERRVFYLVCAVTCLVTFIINKNIYWQNEVVNYPITQDNLTSEDKGKTYHYINEEMGISIFFPKSWNGHYGINEDDSEIRVCYLKDGKPASTSNLIFKIKKGEYIEDDRDDEFICSKNINETNYWIFGPKQGNKFSGDDSEYAEYKKMLKYVEKLKIKHN